MRTFLAVGLSGIGLAVLGACSAAGGGNGNGEAVASSSAAWTEVRPPARGAATTIPAFTITGRVAVDEPDTCDGGNNGDLTTTAVMSWTACHALKEHFDATGKAITDNNFVSPAYTPVPSTITVQLSCYYSSTTTDWPPRVFTAQTDFTGAFSVSIPQSSCGNSGAQGVSFNVSASLSHDIDDSTGQRVGTVRTVWDQALGETVYRSVLSALQPPLYMTTDAAGESTTTVATATTHNWVIPTFVLTFDSVPFPLPQTVSIGPQYFYDGAVAADYDYVRATIQAFHTTVSLHRKLQALLDPPTYAGMFYNPAFSSPATDAAYACDHCFTLRLVEPSLTDSGGFHEFSLSRPQTFSGTDASLAYGTMVSWGLPAHEFGHSMAAALAPLTFGLQDDSMQAMLSPQGVVSSYHTSNVYRNVLQQQENGQAMNEGIADAIGAFFLSDCAIDSVSARGYGDFSPLDNMWSSPDFEDCDSTSPECPFWAFRFQMSRRNVGAGSSTWNTRLASLGSLATQANALGGNMVINNSEMKYRNLFCDLLVSPDVGFAAGLTAGKSYVSDYTWLAAEILDGRTPAVVVKTYASDPPPQSVVVNMTTLFSALNNFIPHVNAYPSPIPPPLWESATIVDGANEDYNNVRLSYKGALSPQSFGMYLVAEGKITKAQLNGILRLNLMDEVV